MVSKVVRQVGSIGLLTVIGACDVFTDVACTLELGPNMVVEVRDSVTGRPIALGASGWIQSGEYKVELYPLGDSLRLFEDVNEKHPGWYTVLVRKPGYRTWIRSGIKVEEDECHAITERVGARLQPDPMAVRIESASYSVQVVTRDVSQARAVVASNPGEIRINGVIPGGTTCGDPRPEAYLSNTEVQVRFQYTNFTRRCLEDRVWSDFEIRYVLPSGKTYQVVVASPINPPGTILDASVRVP